MMSGGEWATILIFAGTMGSVILVAFIYLIRMGMKQAAEKARAEKEAEDNAAAIAKLRKADNIVASPLSLDDTIKRLRDGDF